jgi:hypothetical protein
VFTSQLLYQLNFIATSSRHLLTLGWQPLLPAGSSLFAVTLAFFFSLLAFSKFGLSQVTLLPLVPSAKQTPLRFCRSPALLLFHTSAHNTLFFLAEHSLDYRNHSKNLIHTQFFSASINYSTLC